MSASRTPTEVQTTALEQQLLDAYQRDLPLEPRPYRRMAETIGTDEATVIAALTRLREAGAISRIGAVVAPHRAGYSTLAAMSVPEERLEDVAERISARPEVNHNYEREHRLNLWFVVTGHDRGHVRRVLDEIAAETGIEVLDLPLVTAYRLDLAFPLEWTSGS